MPHILQNNLQNYAFKLFLTIQKTLTLNILEFVNFLVQAYMNLLFYKEWLFQENLKEGFIIIFSINRVKNPKIAVFACPLDT
jgi:hypothetical protein